MVEHFPAIVAKDLTAGNVTGAGDSLVGALLASLVSEPELFQSPRATRKALAQAQQAAVYTLQSPEAVSRRLAEIRVE